MHNRSQISPIIGTNIKFTRKGRPLLDVDHVELGAPGVTSIIGHNGAGKSLLLKVLTGLVEPDMGSVTWNGKRPSRDGYKALGYMKQNAVLLRRSAKANLEFPLLQNGYSKVEASQKAEKALHDADLIHIADSSARVLSGGERQRLSLARMLIVEPDIIILDEPTASLDPQSTSAIETMILAQKAAGKSITLVTHSLSQAKSLSDDILFLNQAKIFPRKSVNSFFNESENETILNFLNA